MLSLTVWLANKASFFRNRLPRRSPDELVELALDDPGVFPLTLEGGMALEPAYVTAIAALAPFAKVVDLLERLLPIGGAVNAGTVCN